MRFILKLAIVALLLGGCGAADDEDTATQGTRSIEIVATSTILGDVVQQAMGDAAHVEVLMPIGADPHEFAPSLRQVADMAAADLVVANGAGFEAAMADVLDSVEADGTPVFRFADHIDLLGDDANRDPHFWTDPQRMAEALREFERFAIDLPAVDGSRVTTTTATYLDDLLHLGDELDDELAAIPDERRVLVTDHEVFSYFAERFDFTVVGAIVPSLSTGAEASAADITALAELIRTRQVPAIFASTTEPTQLADALATEVGNDVQVVELFTESLGPPGSGAETYVDFMRTDAQRIAEALTT